MTSSAPPSPHPSPFAPTAGGTTARTRLRRAAVAAVVVAIVAGGAVVATRGSSSPTGYRTAVVGRQAVAQELSAVATIEPVRQASVAFPVAGTVSAVYVGLGDTVATGESLALLDTTSLTRALHTKQAALDKAELILQKALDGEDVSSLVRSSGSGPGSGSGSGSAGFAGANVRSTGTALGEAAGTTDAATVGVGGAVGVVAAPTRARRSSPVTASFGSGRPAGGSGATTAPGPTAGQVRAAAQAVADAQRQVDAALAAARAGLASSDRVCSSIDTTPPTTTTTTTTAVPSTSTTAPTSVTTTTAAAGAEPGASITACTTALATVQADQQAVAVAQQRLATASGAYAGLLATAGSGSSSGSGRSGSTSGATGTGTGSPSGTRRGSGSGAGSGSGLGAGSTATAPTAADLVSYQRSVDAATAEVAVAQQAIDQARVVSPIDGTVVQVGLTVGSTVTAGSATEAIVVVGRGGYEVTTTVSVAKISQVKVGQQARVTPDGAKRSIAGKVVGIGVAGTTSGSSTTYPVVIGLTGDTSSLGNGATASVDIVTDAVADALAVPTSAVTTAGTSHTVQVVHDGTARTVAVTIGAVGRVWTEIRSGLTAGQEVVLADLSQPLPGSATSSSNGSSTNRNGRTGGFVFPGGGAGGFGGNRPGG